MAIRGKKEEQLTFSKADYEGRENVIIEDCHACQVVLPFPVKAVYIKNITECTIYVACCSGATFVDRATDCNICLQSHQIRIHNSERTNFYLTARSNPIIEHCSQMGFGPYRVFSSGASLLTYPTAE